MLQLYTSERCLVFPKVQPSACYEERPYSYFRPTPLAWPLSLGIISLVRPSWYCILSLDILVTSASIPTERSIFRGFYSPFVSHGQLISSVMTRFDSWMIMRASTLLGASQIEGHPRMLGHCSLPTLASVSGASTKVALSLQGLGLAKPRRKVSSGLRYVG